MLLVSAPNNLAEREALDNHKRPIKESVWHLTGGVTLTLKQRHDCGRLRVNDRVVLKAVAADWSVDDGRRFHFEDKAERLLVRHNVPFTRKD